MVNNIETCCMRDTGCDTVLVDQSLIKKDQYLPQMTYVEIGNGELIKCKTAKIFVDTPWITDEIVVLVMQNCKVPIIIENIKGVRPDNALQIFMDWLKDKSSI